MQIVLATNNQDKIREFSALMSEKDVAIIPQSKFSVPEAKETGKTFVENAILKARHAAKYTNLPSLADDSGLVVGALNGAPGIKSARYSGPKATYAKNIAKLLKNLEGIPEDKRIARFYCLLVFLRHEKDPSPIICQGVWEGRILLEPQGENGFGYDSIFYVPTHGVSAAELLPSVKNAISHRGQAIRKIMNYKL
ncbi:MAG: RdgB/HAM1 family non-canonical purine NTP pyrophosphatase [Gammaproteobacteria bacterium]